ncbi:MAG: phosphosulfolactate synthase [Bacillota bacterium]
MAFWQEIIGTPPENRSLYRPRKTGVTMVLDKGLGLAETQDLLEVASSYLDFLKLGFGTAALYNPSFLAKKIELVRSYGIDIYPGGTFLEIAMARGRLAPCLKQLLDLGFTTVEISDGSVSLDRKTREYALYLAKEMGFTVLAEVGKKNPSIYLNPAEMARQVIADLEAGARWVIIEGRENGCQTGVYDARGRIKEGIYQTFLAAVKDPAVIIWEAPRKSQQVEFINRFGPDVNLGNIPPGEVLALEAMRRGLRGDTINVSLRDEQERDARMRVQESISG